eukprot:INCI18076.3.p1 GENE.INCI18076.3~~INCI18076.3.p1  ORF type:complete len:1054 (-),score=136.60 INCI18076.3:559-3720(-)
MPRHRQPGDGGGAGVPTLSRDQAEEIIGCESLDLRGARLDLQSEYDFFRGLVPRMKRLLVVDLSGTQLSDEAAPLLFELARPQRGVLSLDVSRNDLGPNALNVLTDCVARHVTLQRLDCSRNINLLRNDQQVGRLGHAIGSCKSLTSVGVSFPRQVVVGDSSVQAGEMDARDRLRNALADFYQANNPVKTAHVDTFLRRYHGMEREICKSLRQKYPRSDLDAVEQAVAGCIKSQTTARQQRELHRITAKHDEDQNFALAFARALVTTSSNKGSAGIGTNSPTHLDRHNMPVNRSKRRPCRLGVLEMSSTQISVRELLGMQKLGLFGPRLHVLHLRGCSIASPGAKVLAGFLADQKVLPSLIELDLMGNGIDDEGGCELVKALGSPAAASLVVLDLSSNRLGPATVCELALALTTNFTLCEVRLSDGVLDGEGLSELVWALNSNPLSPLWRLLAEGLPPQAASADGATPGAYFGDMPGSTANYSFSDAKLARTLRTSLLMNWHRWVGTFHPSLLAYTRCSRNEMLDSIVPQSAVTLPALGFSSLARADLIAIQMRHPKGFESLGRALPSSPGNKSQRQQEKDTSMLIPYGANGSWLPKPRLLSERIRASSTENSTPETLSPSVLWFSMAHLHTNKPLTSKSGQSAERAGDMSSAFAIVWTTMIRQELFGKQLPWRLVAFPAYPDDSSRPNADADAPGARFEIAQGSIEVGQAQDDGSDDETDRHSSDSGDERRRKEADDLQSSDVAHRRARTAVAFVWTTPFLHNFRVQIELGVPVSFLGRRRSSSQAQSLATRLCQLQGASLFADSQLQTCVLASENPLLLTVCTFIVPTKKRQRRRAQSNWVLARKIHLPSIPYRSGSHPSSSRGIKGAEGLDTRSVTIRWQWKMEPLISDSSKSAVTSTFEGTLHWEVRLEQLSPAPPVVYLSEDPSRPASLVPAPSDSPLPPLVAGSISVDSTSAQQSIIQQVPGCEQLLVSVQREFLARDAENSTKLVHESLMESTELNLRYPKSRIRDGQNLELWVSWEPIPSGANLVDSVCLLFVHISVDACSQSCG